MNKFSCGILILVGLVACVSVSVSALNHTICEQEKSSAKISKVIVNECEALVSEPCPFYRGLNTSIELDFVPKQKVEQVKVKVIGKLNTLPVVFLVNPDNACGNYGFNCPLEPEKSYKFKLTLPVLRSYPKVNVDVFLRLIDEKGDLLSCLEFPVNIREPAKPSP